ncbi:MAG TPA: hypothetical protein VD763_02520 [Candidatus Saccharimonadales bacterium]|nr:hypothetical protein [Candidatus Saccharimonadales bacterium]
MSESTPTVTPHPSTTAGSARAYLATTSGADAVRWLRAHPDLGGALVFGVLAAAVYLWTSDRDRQELDYFVRLADAFLHGRLYVTEAPSWLNELIPAGPGRWYVAYPPLPAILLMPIVAVFGTGIHQQIPSAILGGAAVALAWLAFGRFVLTPIARVWLTAAFGFGTVLWYVAEGASVWYFAHVVAVLFSLGALIFVLDRRWPLLAGFLLGCAAFSRLPVGLAAPAFLMLALGIGWPLRLPEDRRAAMRTTILFGIGIAVPLGAYALYNIVRWGTLTDQGYTLIPGVLEDPIYVDHGILSIHYIPRNLYAMFFRSWNYVDQAPYLQPSWWGLSLFLTTPLYLWLAKGRLRDPRVFASVIGIVLVSLPILTHGNVGITQFGYRFSLDFQVLLFVILATVFERGMSRLAMVAAGLGIVFCAYAIWAIGIDFVAF